MPDYAYVYANLKCPTCGTAIAKRAMIQWGYCGGYFPTEGSIYEIGDAINWQACDDGSIRPWTYFTMKDQLQVSNIGDPAYTDLIVCDRWHFEWQDQQNQRDPGKRLRCKQCSTPYDGAAVEIRSGVIRRAWVFTPGEFGDTEADCLIVRENGLLEPKPEWNDHRMDNITPCWSSGGFWREIW